MRLPALALLCLLGATPSTGPPLRPVIGQAVQQLQTGAQLAMLPPGYRAELAVYLTLYDQAMREGQERAFRQHMNQWIEAQAMRRFLEKKQ